MLGISAKLPNQVVMPSSGLKNKGLQISSASQVFKDEVSFGQAAHKKVPQQRTSGIISFVLASLLALGAASCAGNSSKAYDASIDAPQKAVTPEVVQSNEGSEDFKIPSSKVNNPHTPSEWVIEESGGTTSTVVPADRLPSLGSTDADMSRFDGNRTSLPNYEERVQEQLTETGGSLTEIPPLVSGSGGMNDRANPEGRMPLSTVESQYQEYQDNSGGSLTEVPPLVSGSERMNERANPQGRILLEEIEQNYSPYLE